MPSSPKSTPSSRLCVALIARLPQLSPHSGWLEYEKAGLVEEVMREAGHRALVQTRLVEISHTGANFIVALLVDGWVLGVDGEYSWSEIAQTCVSRQPEIRDRESAWRLLETSADYSGVRPWVGFSLGAQQSMLVLRDQLVAFARSFRQDDDMEQRTALALGISRPTRL